MAGDTVISSLLTKVAQNGGTAQGTTETAFTQSGVTPAAAAVTYIPGASKCANQAIRILACGRVTGGTTTNITIAMYLQNSTTLTSGNKIATTGAIACNSASGNFRLVADIVIDSTSKTAGGSYGGHLNATIVAGTVITNQVSQDPTAADLPVMLSSTFSASNAGNIAILDNLVVEYL